MAYLRLLDADAKARRDEVGRWKHYSEARQAYLRVRIITSEDLAKANDDLAHVAQFKKWAKIEGLLDEDLEMRCLNHRVEAAREQINMDTQHGDEMADGYFRRMKREA